MAPLVDPPAALAGYAERAFTFGRHGTLVGILTTPTGGVAAMPVVILSAGIIHRIGPSRALVVLARALAREGHTTLRFDLSGIGDSDRAPESPLQSAVLSDIGDAIAAVLAATPQAPQPESVALIGFCSGADNALFVAAEDARVRALVLFDPTVHETAGFRRRELKRRLGSARAWWSVLSGRSLWLRLKARSARGDLTLPPDYYGLLVRSRDEADRDARRIADRGVPRLWVLSEGVHRYCNAPSQIRESLPTGWRDDLDTVDWAPQVDHLLSRRDHVDWFVATAVRWLARVGRAVTR